MTLVLLFILPLAGGALAWALSRRDETLCRWALALALGLGLLETVWVWVTAAPNAGLWLLEARWPWVPSLGASFHLALDGLSLLMVGLTYLLGLASVLASWSGIRERVGLFHFLVGAVLTGILGVFMAIDLFLMYSAWELMLIPMVFLIALWGHENRRRAALKFALFTQAGGVLLLLSILGLYFAHGHSTGVYTFAYVELLGTRLGPTAALWLALGFFVAFAIKLPAVPLHTWLPDAHTEAPTGGSMILAGLLLKTGGYGLIRFVLPLFPEAAERLAPTAMVLGVVGILYGAMLAFAQTDLKRLVAYTSVSHLGFVLLGVFARNDEGLRGAVVQMLCHGLSTGALFMLVGALQDRLGTRDMRRMGGLWTKAPALSIAALILALASLGLPGMGNFVGEFLVLLGTYRVSAALAAVGSVGLILAAAFSLRMMQVAFFGPAPEGLELPDLNLRERAVIAAMVLVLLWIGLFAQPVLMAATPAVGMVDGRQGTIPHPIPLVWDGMGTVATPFERGNAP
jgi:NADH-quinone oxidoreductase subunit M